MSNTHLDISPMKGFLLVEGLTNMSNPSRRNSTVFPIKNSMKKASNRYAHNLRAENLVAQYMNIVV